MTTKKRSFGWKCGRLMLPGSHLMRTTYGPGLLGSPKSTACSLVPAAFRTHLTSAGVVELVMGDGELLREPEGGPLARAQEIRGFVVDRGDLRVRRSRMLGPGIAHGESVAAGVEAGDLQPHQFAEHGIDGALAGQG